MSSCPPSCQSCQINDPIISSAAESVAVPEKEKDEIKQNAQERERKIKNLTKQLRTINNVCSPINDYMKFQQFVSPDIRVLMEINQWMLMVFACKAGAKTSIDCEYMDIIEPPLALKEAMAATYNNLESVCESFTNSMKEIVILIQSRLTQPSSPVVATPSTPPSPNSSPSINILSAMTDIVPETPKLSESSERVKNAQIQREKELDSKLP